MTDQARPDQRLAKRLAAMVPCSRSEAERYIEGGWVTVDGVVVEEPQFRVLDQTIELSKDATLLESKAVTFLLHKPAGKEPVAADLSLVHRSPDDRSGIRLLKRHFASAELITPLATAASGLVVFTDDWRVARKLREDASVMEHEVLVEVSGSIKPGGLERLNRIESTGFDAAADLDQHFVLHHVSVFTQLARNPPVVSEHHQPAGS